MVKIIPDSCASSARKTRCGVRESLENLQYGKNYSGQLYIKHEDDAVNQECPLGVAFLTTCSYIKRVNYSISIVVAKKLEGYFL